VKLNAEDSESHDSLQWAVASLAWRAATAPWVLHQSVCVRDAEIDDGFYALLGISR
jgi:hypothetical protein